MKAGEWTNSPVKNRLLYVKTFHSPPHPSISLFPSPLPPSSLLPSPLLPFPLHVLSPLPLPSLSSPSLLPYPHTYMNAVRLQGIEHDYLRQTATDVLTRYLGDQQVNLEW